MELSKYIFFFVEYLLNSSTIDQKIISLLSKHFRQGFQTCILCLHRKTLRVFFEKKSVLIKILFGQGSKFLGLHCKKNFRQSCQNCCLKVQGKLWGTYFPVERLFYRYLPMIESFLVLSRNSQRVWQNCISSFHSKNLRFFCRNFLFFSTVCDIKRSKFGLLQKFFQRLVNSAFYMSIKTL